MKKELIKIRLNEISKQIGAVSKMIFATKYNIKRYRIRDIRYKRKHEIKRLLNMQASKMEDYNKKVQKLRWWIRQLLRENKRLLEGKLK